MNRCARAHSGSQRDADRQRRNPRQAAEQPKTTALPPEASGTGAPVAQPRIEASSCGSMYQPLHLLGASSTHGKSEVQHNGLNLFNSRADNRTIVRFV